MNKSISPPASPLPAEADTPSLQLLSFALQKDEPKDGLYAIEVSHVREIVPAPHITPLPGSAREHLGLVSLRGNLVSVFGLSELVLDKPGPIVEGQLIVTDHAHRLRAYLVSRIGHIQHLPREALRPLDEDSDAHELVLGIIVREDESLLSVLDLARLAAPPSTTEHSLSKLD